MGYGLPASPLCLPSGRYGAKSALAEQLPAFDLVEIFQKSRDQGLAPENLHCIATEWARRLNLSEDDVRNYLTENIYYSLDPACLEGLRLFYEYAAEIAALPSPPDLSFLETAKEVAS